MVVGTLDLMFEDSLAMAARWSAAGGQVNLRVYPESPHGFTSFPTAMAAAATTSSWITGKSRSLRVSTTKIVGKRP